jgi:ABC-2 type transport system permease protein
VSRILRIGMQRAILEIKSSLRNGQSLGFTLLFPIVLLVLFATIFSGTIKGTGGVSVAQYFIASIMGSVVMSTGFVSTAISVAFDRDAGLLKRLAGTPMPKASFFLGRVIAVFLLVLAQAAILMILGVVFYDLRLPTSPARWFTFAWVILLGALSSALLGLAVGGRIRNAKAGPAVVNLPFVVLQFISGVFLPFSDLSATLKTVSGLFPLRWLAQGMRSVFLPDSYQAVEEHLSWQHGRMFLTLAIWLIIGLTLCLTTFKWVDEKR